MKTALVAVAALVLSMGSAFAQANVDADAGAQGEALQNRFNVDNVMPDDPFGDIDVDMAMVGDQLRSWGEGLSDEQRLEISNRCAVITTNMANYDTAAVNFCNEFTATGALDNPAAQ